MNGLSSALRHTISLSSPPARVAARRFVKASTASSKNMTPKRETTASKLGRLEVVALGVGHDEVHRHAFPLGALAGGGHHRLGDVDARARALRAEAPAQRHGRGAGAAADVEHATADIGVGHGVDESRSSGRYSSSSTSWSSTQLLPPRPFQWAFSPMRCSMGHRLWSGNGCAICKTLPDGSRTIARRSP